MRCNHKHVNTLPFQWVEKYSKVTAKNLFRKCKELYKIFTPKNSVRPKNKEPGSNHRNWTKIDKVSFLSSQEVNKVPFCSPFVIKEMITSTNFSKFCAESFVCGNNFIVVEIFENMNKLCLFLAKQIYLIQSGIVLWKVSDSFRRKTRKILVFHRLVLTV